MGLLYEKSLMLRRVLAEKGLRSRALNKFTKELELSFGK